MLDELLYLLKIGAGRHAVTFSLLQPGGIKQDRGIAACAGKSSFDVQQMMDAATGVAAQSKIGIVGADGVADQKDERYKHAKQEDQEQRKGDAVIEFEARAFA